LSEKRKHSDNRYGLPRILDYLKGDRKGKNAHDLEKAAENDPFLGDALEGYDRFGDESKSGKHLREIEDYVNYRVSQESNSPNKQRILAVAASIVVLVSASLWVWFSLFNQLADPNLIDTPQLEGKEEPVPEVIEENQDFEDEVLLDQAEEVIQEPETEKEPVLQKEQEEVLTIPSQSGIAETTESVGSGEISEPEMDELADSQLKATNSLDEIINQLLQEEKEFWLAERQEDDLAFNRSMPEIKLAEEESVPMEEPAPLASKPRKRSKKEKSAAGAAVLDEVAKSDLTVEPKIQIEPEAIIDSVASGQISVSLQKRLEEDESLSIIHAIYLIKANRQSEAIDILQKIEGRNEQQKGLIDSLKAGLQP
jgi:hypothetical protein